MALYLLMPVNSHLCRHTTGNDHSRCHGNKKKKRKKKSRRFETSLEQFGGTGGFQTAEAGFKVTGENPVSTHVKVASEDRASSHQTGNPPH